MQHVCNCGRDAGKEYLQLKKLNTQNHTAYIEIKIILQIMPTADTRNTINVCNIFRENRTESSETAVQNGNRS